MNRAENAIAARREWSDEAYFAGLDAAEAREERVKDEAAAVAAEIVSNPDRLAALIERGDLLLYEINVNQDGETMTIERAMARLIASSLRFPHVGLQHIARAIAEHLAATTDVLEKAEVRLAEQDADAEESIYDAA